MSDLLRYAQRSVAELNADGALERMETLIQRIRAERKRGNPGNSAQYAAEIGQQAHTLAANLWQLFWLDEFGKGRTHDRE